MLDQDTSNAMDFDSRTWTGNVDEQRNEGKALLIGLILALAIAVPLAIWIGQGVSRSMGF